MRALYSNLILITAISLMVLGCANRGTPTGGEVDTTPPVVVRSAPENFSTNFDGDEIRVYFNEYIKLQNVQRQLIISPPMNTPPEVTPLGSASKYLKIKIFDTLQPNTTYAFNFGESIVDNNEENPYPFFKYVFSTGDYIDSLSINGVISDAFNREADDFVSVILHEIDSTYNDSIIYNQIPKYITNTLDSTTAFSLENLKAGRYLLSALKESNNNYVYNPKTDKLGFYNEIITVPADSNAVFNIKLFQEELDFKIVRPAHISKHKIAFGYEGDPDSVSINIVSNVPKDFRSKILKETDKDSLNFWFNKELEVDSLLFEVRKKNYIDTVTVRVLQRDKDSLVISQISDRTLKLDQDMKLQGTTPIDDLDNSKISIINQDSIAIEVSSTLDTYNNIATLSFDKEESSNYSVQMLPGAFTDFFGVQNDTLNFNVNTRPLTDYGDVRVILENASYPIIVQLTNADGEVQTEQYHKTSGFIDFRYLTPGDYYVRVIFDENENGKYDTGNYLLKRQPERVSHADSPIEVTAYTEQIVTVTLKREE